jgi:hypothetical protein
MWQSYHQLLNINDLKNSRNDWNEIEVSVKIPVPAIFRARDRKEFLQNFEPSLQQQVRKLVHYSNQNDSWIDDDHTELLWRCNLLFDCDDEMSKNEEKLKGELD